MLPRQARDKHRETTQTKRDAFPYSAIKAIDPFHIVAGAVDGGCSSTFSDGEGPGGSLTLSLDVPLNENYNPDLHSRTGPGVSENTVNDW